MHGILLWLVALALLALAVGAVTVVLAALGILED